MFLQKGGWPSFPFGLVPQLRKRIPPMRSNRISVSGRKTAAGQLIRLLLFYKIFCRAERDDTEEAARRRASCTEFSILCWGKEPIFLHVRFSDILGTQRWGGEPPEPKIAQHCVGRMIKDSTLVTDGEVSFSLSVTARLGRFTVSTSLLSPHPYVFLP